MMEKIFFFLKIVFFYFITFIFGLLIPKQRNLVVLSSSKGKYYNGNAKALFEYIKTRDDLEAYYFVSKKGLFNSLSKERKNIVYHYSCKGLFMFLRARTVCITHGQGDFLGFFPWFSQNWIFLGHGVGTKALGYLKENLQFIERCQIFLNQFLVYTINSDFDKYMFSSMNLKKPSKIRITGYPRMDVLYKKRFNREAQLTKNILYAPTYRKNGITEIFPFEEFELNRLKKLLENLDINLNIRFHPNNYEGSRDVLNDLFSSSERIKDVSPDIISDVQDVLIETDILVTDFSSISRDFLFLDRPIIFVMNGIEDLGNEVLPLRKEYSFCGYKVYTYKDFEKAIKEISQGKDRFSDVRRFVRDLMYNYVDDCSSKRVTELIKELS